MASYSFEKGKHGGPCGVIFPFFREINGSLPLDQDYRDYVPAGYLKCRGQVLQSDQFPQLAELVGVGDTCIYKKDTTVLQNRNDSGTGGTFQIPDLGSKFITSAANPGGYINDTVQDTTNNLTLQRAGIATLLQSGGTSIEFSYTGDFKAPKVTLSFSGSWKYISPKSSTNETTLGISNFVAHGHLGSYTIASQINRNAKALKQGKYNYNFWAPCWKSDTVCTPNGNAGVKLLAISYEEAGEDVSHKHNLPTPTLSASGPSGSIPEVTMSAGSIITTVNIKTKEIFKMDDIAPKFILCEYLIKF